MKSVSFHCMHCNNPSQVLIFCIKASCHFVATLHTPFAKNKGPLLNESLLDRLTPPPAYYAVINKTLCQRYSVSRINLGSYLGKNLRLIVPTMSA